MYNIFKKIVYVHVFHSLTLKVKWWITHNEPHETCEQGYGWGTFAPGYNKHPGTETYLCAHNIIKSHAAAWHLYNKKYREQQQGACVSHI